MPVKKYVDYSLYIGFFPERTKVQIEKRDVLEAVRNMPIACFGFKFVDVEYEIAKTDKGEEFEVSHTRTNETGMYYPGGILYSYKQIKDQFPKEEILLKNMEYNNWGFVVKTRKNNFRPFWPNDELVCDLR